MATLSIAPPPGFNLDIPEPPAGFKRDTITPPPGFDIDPKPPADFQLDKPSLSRATKVEPVADEFGIGEEVRGLGRALARGARGFVQQGTVTGLRRPAQLEAELKGLETDLASYDKEFGDKPDPNDQVGFRWRNDQVGKIALVKGELDRYRKMAPALAQSLAGQQTAIEKLPPTTAQREFQESDAKLKTFLKNPVEIASGAFVESLPMMAGPIVGSAFGPAGTAAGAAASSFSAESSSRILSGMQKQGVDLKDPRQVLAFFQDAAKRDPVTTKADLAALGPATFDTLTAGFAGQFLKRALGKGAKAVAVATAAEIGMQMAGGGAGSIAASKLAGEPIDWGDVLLEIVLEAAPFEAVGNVHGEIKASRLSRANKVSQNATEIALPSANVTKPSESIISQGAQNAIQEPGAAQLPVREETSVSPQVAPEVRSTEIVAGKEAQPQPVAQDVVTYHATETEPGKGQKSGYYPGVYTSPDVDFVKQFGGKIFSTLISPEKIYQLQDGDALKHEAASAGFGTHSGNGNAEVEFLKSKGYIGMGRGKEVILFDNAAPTFSPVEEPPPTQPQTQGPPPPKKPTTTSAPPTDVAPKTRLDLLLDGVERTGKEVTIEVTDANRDNLTRIIDTAKQRGLDASTDGRFVLVRKAITTEPIAKQPKGETVKQQFDRLALDYAVVHELPYNEILQSDLSVLHPGARSTHNKEVQRIRREVLKRIGVTGDAADNATLKAALPKLSAEVAKQEVTLGQDPVDAETRKAIDEGETGSTEFLPAESVSVIQKYQSKEGVNNNPFEDALFKSSGGKAKFRKLSDGRVEITVPENAVNSVTRVLRAYGVRSSDAFYEVKTDAFGKELAVMTFLSHEQSEAKTTARGETESHLRQDQVMENIPTPESVKAESDAALLEEINQARHRLENKKDWKLGERRRAQELLVEKIQLWERSTGNLSEITVPKLGTSEKGTGELFKGADQPFNLAGESGIDTERVAREKAAAEQRAVEAKAIADKQQQTLPGTATAAAKELADKFREQFTTPSSQQELGTFGIAAKVINAAVEVAAKIIEQGGKVVDAINAAIDYIRKNHTGTFDEAAVRAKLEERIQNSSVQSTTTEVHGIEDTVERPVFGPKEREQARAETKVLFQETGMPLSDGPGETLEIDSNFESDPEARRLEGIVKRELQSDDPATVLRRQTFLDVVRLNARNQIDRINRGEHAAWTLEQATRLYNLAQSEISFTGQKLAAIPRIPDSEEILVQALNIDTTLKANLARQLAGDGEGGHFGADTLIKVINRLLTHFKDFFTDEEVNKLRDENADMNDVVKRLELLAMKDQGSIVFRMAHGRLKPKAKAKLAALLRNARVQEAVEAIIEQAKRNGVDEKKSTGAKLRAGDRLLHMIEPKTAEKIDESIRVAVRDAELAAGRKVALKDTSLSDEDRMLIEQGIVEPTEEQIEAGLSTPEFAHWRVIRDNLLGYSPVTDSLVQKVLREDFKGTKFAKPGAPKPADTRINLTALAKAPEQEVARVIKAYLSNLETQMNLRKASPGTIQRVLAQIRKEVEVQLGARRKEFLDNFFDPKERVPTTASARLRALLNAGVSKDTRFLSGKIQALIKRINVQHVNADEVESLATSTRQEKRNWIDRKTDEILGKEKLRVPDVDSVMADYAEAVTRTYLAERLQATEEGLTRSFLKGADVKFDRTPVTPEERAQRVEEAKARLEGLIRAGAFDTALVDEAARKNAVQKLMPKFGELIQRALSMPAKDRRAFVDNFATQLVDQFGIDPAVADKAADVFGRALETKFAVAIEKAQKQALNSLAKDDKAAVETQKQGKSLWELVVGAVNSGTLDESAIVAEMARRRGLKPPPNTTINKIKELVAREQKLREMTPAEIDKAGGDASKLEAIRQERLATTEDERRIIQKRIEVLMKSWAVPLGLKHWFDANPNVARNNAQAINEMASSNILTRVLGVGRQAMDILSLNLFYVPWHRALAYGINRRRAGIPDAPTMWGDMGDALKEAATIRLKALRATIATIRPSLQGRGVAQRIEDLETGVRFGERLLERADALWKEGSYESRVRATLIRFYALQRLGVVAFAAIDAVQSTSAEWQEMRHQLGNYLREKGFTKPQREVAIKDIFGDLPTDYTNAVNDARGYFAGTGTEPTDAQLRKYTWDLVKQRAYAKMAALEAPVDDFQAKTKAYNQAQAWNLKPGGIGGAVFATPAKAIQEALANLGIPTLGLFAFSNAIGTAFNRGATWSGLGLFPGLFKGDPFFASEVDRTQRKLEAITGLSMWIPLAALTMTGVLAVRLGWPKEEREREKWRLNGIKPYTVEIPVGDGKVIRVPLRVGPMAPFAPGLAAAGTLRAKIDDRERRQAKLNEEAAKKGLTAEQLPGLNMGDMAGIAASGVWQMLTGGRTMSGALGAYTDYGNFDAKKFAATYLRSAIPLVPAWNEAMRGMGVEIDPKTASFMDMLVATPGSSARRVNVLGDSVADEGAIERIVDMVTLGGGIRKQTPDAMAYAALYSSGYMPPAIDANKPYNVGGTLRALKGQELSRYTELRGQYLKEELSALGPEPTQKEARAAYQRANTRALGEIGVSPKTRSQRSADEIASPTAPLSASRSASGGTSPTSRSRFSSRLARGVNARRTGRSLSRAVKSRGRRRGFARLSRAPRLA